MVPEGTGAISFEKRRSPGILHYETVHQAGLPPTHNNPVQNNITPTSSVVCDLMRLHLHPIPLRFHHAFAAVSVELNQHHGEHGRTKGDCFTKEA